MKLSFLRFGSLLLAAVLGLTGCEQARDAKNAYSAVVTSTKAAKEMASGMQEVQARQEDRAKRGDTLAINYKELEKYLPATAASFTPEGNPEGQSMQMPGMRYSMAKQNYRKGDETLSVTLMDYNGAAPMFLAATAMMNTGMEMENDDQLMRGLDLGLPGVKAFETLEKKNHQATIVLSVANRFLATVEASGQNDTELVKSVAKGLKLSKISEL